ncbi:MAG: HEAT repeat domain-containing protein [Planctomycetes bacterium]|nr:HEAT repeat domain-containing protein [Planctomycetota bacterium]
MKIKIAFSLFFCIIAILLFYRYPANAQDMENEEDDIIIWESPDFQQPEIGTAVPSLGAMVNSTEFKSLKTFWNSLDESKSGSKESLESLKIKSMESLSAIISSIEGKQLSGRWVRKFFEDELSRRFQQQVITRKFEAPENPGEKERTIRFWKEIDFCLEGLVTLSTLKDCDSLILELLSERIKRNFNDIKTIRFKGRLEILNISRDKYKEKIVRLSDEFAGYKKTLKGDSTSIICISKEPVTDLSVRQPKPLSDGEWMDFSNRPDKSFKENDLLDILSKEDKKVILSDRRYIILEGGSLVTGWELDPKIPDDLIKDIARLIGELGNDDWQTRETATKELIDIGEPVIIPLNETLEKNPDPEVRMRAKFVLSKLKKDNSEGEIRKLIEEFIQNGGGNREVIDKLRKSFTPEQLQSVIKLMLQEDTNQPNQNRIAMIQFLMAFIEEFNSMEGR